MSRQQRAPEPPRGDTEGDGRCCVVCGAAMTSQYPAMAAGFEILACAGCGSRRTFPSLPESEIGAFYPPAYYGEKDRRFVAAVALLARVLRKARAKEIAGHEPVGRVLDVGCGGGQTLAELRAWGWETYGIELSELSAAHARSLGIDVRTDLYDPGLPLGGFQIVSFWHSLEHMRDPNRALRRAATLLRPGGLLVVAVPNSASLEARAFGNKWFHLDVPRHYHHFTTASTRMLLEKAGFYVEATGHRNIEQNPYGVLQSALNSLGFEENLLYSMLKVPGARAHELRHHPLQVLLTAALAPALAATSLAVSLAETFLLGEGGTIEVRARLPMVP